MPKKPAMIAVTAFIPILKLKKLPIELIRNNSIAPITPFIINFISILIGHEKTFTISIRPIIDTKKYPIYSKKPPLINLM